MVLINQNLRTMFSAYTVIILFGSSTCLKIVGVAVPALADLRQSASLGCSYDIGQDALFSVKWYKDDQEFYRYMPTHKPSVLTFPLSGASVDENEGSDCGKSRCSVTLEHLTPMASGAYTCEVSTEAPTFRTAIETRNMTVMALPLEKPRIEGLRSAYTVGEQLDIKCRTAPSAPPAFCNFFINDIQMDEKYVSRATEAVEEEMFVTSARLRLLLSRGHFLGTLLRIKCSATLAGIPGTVRSTDVTATLAAPQHLDNQKLVKWPSAADHVIYPTNLLIVSCLISLEVFFLFLTNYKLR